MMRSVGGVIAQLETAKQAKKLKRFKVSACVTVAILTRGETTLR